MAVFPAVGDFFGPYHVTGTLGHGGMGIVLSAVHRGLDRRVALKILSPELATQPEFRERFSREANALARLYSPHIIDIYDHGEIDGCLFIATQLVNGGDLGGLLRSRGALPPAQGLELMAQISSALADAHDAGIVHRDIKPSNVLLHQSPDGELFAYLCDFGIAQTNDENRTRTRGLVGTLGYMAPERHEGATADVASDVYSLGCLLWATLTAHAPYAGTDVQVAMQHLHGTVPTYSGEGTLATAVNAVLQQSMAKRPEERYASAAAMRKDLQRAAGTAGGSAQAVASPSMPAPRPLSTAKPAPSRRPLVWRLAGVLTVLLVATAVLGWRAWVSDPPVAAPPARDRLVTCWNGLRVVDRSTCSDPAGLDGMHWVFPSFGRDFETCHRRFDATPDASLQSWFCPTKGGDPGDGITYTAWVSPAAARRAHDRHHPDPPGNFLVEGNAVGYRWFREEPGQSGFFQLSVAYLNLPFSSSVRARSQDGIADGCATLLVRSLRTFRARPTVCTRRLG